jgi:glycosyltransferase involved in cell wall biosynthesis
MGRGSSDVDVSIVVPCFNHGDYLGEAVASAQACRTPRCEVIVVDDGSDDDRTRAALDEVRAAGVRVLEQPNRGPGAARNAGIEAARGRYLLPLDADNRLRPEYPAIGAELLDRDPTLGVVYADSELFGDRRGRRRPGPFDATKLLRGNYIDVCAVFRREVWEDTGGYLTGARTHSRAPLWEDWDLWLGAVERGWGFRYVPDVLYDYRIRADAPSSRRHSREWRERRAAIAARHPALFRNGGFDLRAYLAARDPALYGRVAEARQAVGSWIGDVVRRGRS